MFQKGPGEGFHSAKDDVLEREPNARCRLSFNGGIRHYRIFVGEEDVACAAESSRAAWNKFLERTAT
ncbi:MULTISPECIES: hypothetical protein [Aurantimonas]|uniref:hypothetical protein n=1 Tax=Aurantimonas TaxID=182269 RepID=UPI0035165DD3